MSLRTGFRGRVSCPLWLLDCQDVVVIPLAKGRQTNPIYIARPSRSQLYMEPWVRDYEDALTAVGFELGRLRKDLFLSAQVRMADSVTGWINIWRGADLDESGTLLCALMYRQDYRQCCLCGSCREGIYTNEKSGGCCFGSQIITFDFPLTMHNTHA